MSEHKCMQCTHGSVCDDFEGSHAKNCEFFEPENKWISVNDRLPEENKRVLVTDGKYVCEAWGTSATYHPEMVTHWQPLPQPPEDKEKEGL